jgi:hypothetical protein
MSALAVRPTRPAKPPKIHLPYSHQEMIRRSQIQGFRDQGRRIAERSVQGCNNTRLRSRFISVQFPYGRLINLLKLLI